MNSLKSLIQRNKALTRSTVSNLKLMLVLCLAFFASLVGGSNASATFGQVPIRSDPPVRLHAPWSEYESADNEVPGTRYPDTYCTKQANQTWPQTNCDVNGHPSQGLWGAVDLFLTRRFGDPGNRGGWEVRAAHDGEASFDRSGGESKLVVRVTDTKLGLQTGYNHVLFAEAHGTSRPVKAGDLLAVVHPDGKHLMFWVKKNGKNVDVRDIELDGQRLTVESNPCPNYNTSGCPPGIGNRFDVTFKLITAQAGLTQALTGATNEANDQFGHALATGDFNGDGRADLAIGVPGEDYSNATDAGIVAVFYGSGSPNGLGPISQWERLGQADAQRSIDNGDQFGSALAVGDFNGDGKGDLAVGVPGEDYNGAADAGIVIIFYGSANGLRPVSHWEAIGQGSANRDIKSGDNFGAALAAGDFNGDGKDDLAVGVPGEDYNNATDAGIVVIFYGSGNGLLPVSHWEALGQGNAGGRDVKSGDRFGSSLAVGNFNGDQQSGRPLMDLAIGVSGEDYSNATDAGIVIVFYGSGNGLLPVSHWEALGQGNAGGADVKSGDRFGSSLAAGDFNGNGKDDLAIGVPGEDHDGATDAGIVTVFYGASHGLIEPVTRWERLGQKRVGGANESGDQFGFALTTGDFDGDGKDDLAVGTPFEDIGSKANAGAVYIFYGSAGGLPQAAASTSAALYPIPTFKAFDDHVPEPIQQMISLQAPWPAGLARYPQTYNGHVDNCGTWCAVDFYTHPNRNDATGGWAVLAAHDGTAEYQDGSCGGRRLVYVTNLALGIRTRYVHVRFPSGVNVGDVKTVKAGDVIAYARNENELDTCQN